MDDCDVLIYTLGIHYDSRGDMIGNHYGNNKFADDFQAAVTSLVDFSSNGKIAVWRSILPQHFNSANGHHPHQDPNGECVPFAQSNLTNIESDDGITKSIQNFNVAANKGFSRHCNFSPKHSCHFQYSCTMNITATNCRTVYKHLIDNNITSKAEAMEKIHEDKGGMVTGDILQWNIADLFNVPQWHSSNSDCSHFCYIPALYEEAFRRLNWLLTMASN